MAVLMFIVLVSFLSVTCGQGSRNQMRGDRDLSSSDAVVKEGIMHIMLPNQHSFSIFSLCS
jgi:small ligand-binding sensory domain FIST